MMVEEEEDLTDVTKGIKEKGGERVRWKASGDPCQMAVSEEDVSVPVVGDRTAQCSRTVWLPGRQSGEEVAPTPTATVHHLRHFNSWTTTDRTHCDD